MWKTYFDRSILNTFWLVWVPFLLFGPIQIAYAQVLERGSLPCPDCITKINMEFLDRKQLAIDLVQAAYEIEGGSEFESIENLFLQVEQNIHSAARIDQDRWVEDPIIETIFNAWDLKSDQFRGVFIWELTGGLRFSADLNLSGDTAFTHFRPAEETRKDAVVYDVFRGTRSHFMHAWLDAFPAYILMVAKRQPYSLTYLGKTTIGDEPAHVVEFNWPVSPKRPRFFLSETNGNLLAMSSDFAFPHASDHANFIVFEGRQRKGNLIAPERIRVHFSETHLLNRRIVDFGEMTEDVKDKIFADIENFPVPTAQWQYVSHGSQVHSIQNVSGLEPVNINFIELDTYLIAFDAPQHPAVTQEALRRVTERTGKSLRYVVISHSHVEHIAGIRTYLSAGATVISPTNGVKVIDQIAQAKTSKFDASALGSPVSDYEIIVIENGDEFDIIDGSGLVHVRNIGRSPHTSQNLLAIVPDDRIVLEGDLTVDGQQPSETQMFFTRYLRRENLEEYLILGMHHRGYIAAEQEVLSDQTEISLESALGEIDLSTLQ